MSKPKFKVGDRVRVRTDLVVGRQYGGLTFLGSMPKRFIIEKVCNYDNTLLAHNGLWYSFDMIEPAKPETIVIYRDGQKVIALDKRTGKRAEVRCNPSDEFVFEVGAQIAFDRLFGREPIKPEPKGFTGKAVYLGGEPSLDCDFTKGKIYKFEDGKTVDNFGDIRPDNDYRFDVDGLGLSDWGFLQIVE